MLSAMAGGDDDTASAPTVADRPAARRPDEPPGSRDEPTGAATVQFGAVGAIGAIPRTGSPAVPPAASPRTASRDGSVTQATTAADALRDEEIERTRLF